MVKRKSQQWVSDRLKQAIRKLGFNYKEFAEKCGIPYRTLQNYISGQREPGASSLEKICTRSGINGHWLLTGEGEMFVKKERVIKENGISLKLIPVIQQHVPEGFPEVELRDKYIVGYIYLPDVPEGAMAVKVKDDSMSPIIEYGEYVVFLVEDKNGIRNGDIVVALNEWNEIVIRRYKEKEREVYLISDNPKYPILKPDQECKIVGKVVRKLSVREV